MKKSLLSTAALAGLALAGSALAAAPARAQEPALQLGVTGFMAAYGVYADQDEPAGTKYRSFDLRKETEFQLNGEIALDNGVTAGAHMELLGDRSDGATTVQESWMFLSGRLGRLIVGEEDGAAYLLQVAPPSADIKLDGPRPSISAFENGADGVTTDTDGVVQFSQSPFGYNNKATYFTPVFKGLQLGVSYIPSVSDSDLAGTAVAQTSNNAGQFDNGWEAAFIYNADLSDGLKLSLGAGYSHASLEAPLAAGGGLTARDDRAVWNAGAKIKFGAFGLGASYIDDNNGREGDADTKAWVLGTDYKIGAYTLGLTYLNADIGNGAVAGADDVSVDRWTAGVIYEWGPGMTFRTAVQRQSADSVDGASGTDVDATQVVVGTMLNF